MIDARVERGLMMMMMMMMMMMTERRLGRETRRHRTHTTCAST